MMSKNLFRILLLISTFIFPYFVMGQNTFYQLKSLTETDVSKIDDDNKQVQARVILNSRLTMQEVEAIFNERDIDIKFYVSEWEGHTTWYNSNVIEKENAIEAYRDHLSFLNKRIAKYKKLFNNSDNISFINEEINQLENLKTYLKKKGEVTINSIVVNSVVKELKALNDKTDIKFIYATDVENVSSIENQESENPSPPVSVPICGNFEWIDDEKINSDFFWEEVSFEYPNIGYEHDIRVDDKDFWSDGEGNVYSNLPSPYIDTRCYDYLGSYEYYTVGSAAADEIEELYLYYIEMPVDIQSDNLNSTILEITPQMGHWAGTTNYTTNQYPNLFEVDFCTTPSAPPYLCNIDSQSPQACIYASDTYTDLPEIQVGRNSSGSQTWGEPETCSLKKPFNGADINSSYKFKWSGDGFSVGYNFQIALDINFNDIYINHIGDCCEKTNITIDDLESGQTYYWRVREYGFFSGWQGWSNIRSFNVYDASFLRNDKEVGSTVDRNNHNKVFNISPNPANYVSNISFKIQKGQNVSLKLYDVNGEEVLIIQDNTWFGEGKYTIPFDVSDLNNGVYFCTLNGSNYSFTEKILVLK